MDSVILSMLQQYQTVTETDYENALKEIMQEIALVGLWRAKFFEHAAFYGGTSLRILYGLNRFSEDLDFSLLQPNPNFAFEDYFKAITDELEAFGFETELTLKQKANDTDIQSAFLKSNTKNLLLKIHAPPSIQKVTHQDKQLKIKIEIDVDPPPNFTTETKTLLKPILFWVKSYTLPNLFAGKLSAVLCRQWQARVKGRDWYDFIWFLQRNTLLNIQHLESRLRQFGFYTETEALTLQKLQSLLITRIDNLDVESAKNDIVRFIKNPNDIEAWSKDLFISIIEHIRA